ncbi:MAG: hypothetical protein Q7R73_01880 [bacterium]|nr:hypothetical protein [bacterium]
MMTNDAEKLAAIRVYVIRERERRGIVTGRALLPELSCEAFGEFYNLVERQLVNTIEGCGAWCELAYPFVLNGAYRYVTEGIRG